MGRKREFKSSRDFPDMPDRTECDDNPSDASPAGSGDEENLNDTPGELDWSQTESVPGTWAGYEDSWQQIGSG